MDSPPVIEPPVNGHKPPKQTKKRDRPHKRSPYSQAVYLQDLCLIAAEKPDATASALAALAKSWNELEDRKRILRGRALPTHEPLPKVARNGRRSQSQSQTLIETDGRFAEATPMPAQAQAPVSESPSTPKPAGETPEAGKPAQSHGK